MGPPLRDRVNGEVRWFSSILWLVQFRKVVKCSIWCVARPLLTQSGFSHVLCNPPWGLTYGLISHPTRMCLIHLGVVSFKIGCTIFITLQHHSAFHFYLPSIVATTQSWNGKQWFSHRFCLAHKHHLKDVWSVIIKGGPAGGEREGVWTSVRSGTFVIFKYDSINMYPSSLWK